MNDKIFLRLLYMPAQIMQMMSMSMSMNHSRYTHSEDLWIEVFQNGIHSDHGYLDTCDNPLGPP